MLNFFSVGRSSPRSSTLTIECAFRDGRSQPLIVLAQRGPVCGSTVSGAEAEARLVILYAPSKRAPTDQMRQKRAPTLIDHKLEDRVVRKPTVLKTPVWQLEPVIRRTFDIPSMARLSVGPSWATLTDAQRQQVTESFGRYISAIYADRFDSYAGQKLQVIGEQPAVAGIMVRSQIVKANGEPVNVDYMMRRNGDSWLISDIYLDGAISEVATRRSEFAAILKSQGIDGLIAALNRKADILTATTAKAS